LNLEFSVNQLPVVNATLNATAALLLVTGWVQIKRRRETAHKVLMLSAFVVSIVFLGCYLVYHYHVGSVKFTGPPAVRAVYLTILLTHVVLAAAVPVLALVTIALGLRDRRAAHRRWARWTFPIWLYVSITGVVVYVMLYHLYPAGGGEGKINGASEISSKVEAAVTK
jgi:putative membrane protein